MSKIEKRETKKKSLTEIQHTFKENFETKKNVLDLSDDLLVFNLQLNDLGLMTSNNHRGRTSHHHTLHVLHIWCPKNIGCCYFNNFCFKTMLKSNLTNLPVLHICSGIKSKYFLTNHSVI